MQPDYRLIVRIKDESTGQIIESDWCTITDTDRIDEFGGCEIVDHTVAKVLRSFRNVSREAHEQEQREDAA